MDYPRLRFQQEEMERISHQIAGLPSMEIFGIGNSVGVARLLAVLIKMQGPKGEGIIRRMMQDEISDWTDAENNFTPKTNRDVANATCKGIVNAYETITTALDRLSMDLKA